MAKVCEPLGLAVHLKVTLGLFRGVFSQWDYYQVTVKYVSVNWFGLDGIVTGHR